MKSNFQINSNNSSPVKNDLSENQNMENRVPRNRENNNFAIESEQSIQNQKENKKGEIEEMNSIVYSQNSSKFKVNISTKTNKKFPGNSQQGNSFCVYIKTSKLNNKEQNKIDNRDGLNKPNNNSIDNHNISGDFEEYDSNIFKNNRSTHINPFDEISKNQGNPFENANNDQVGNNTNNNQVGNNTNNNQVGNIENNNIPLDDGSVQQNEENDNVEFHKTTELANPFFVETEKMKNNKDDKMKSMNKNEDEMVSNSSIKQDSKENNKGSNILIDNIDNKKQCVKIEPDPFHQNLGSSYYGVSQITKKNKDNNKQSKREISLSKLNIKTESINDKKLKNQNLNNEESFNIDPFEANLSRISSNQGGSPAECNLKGNCGLSCSCLCK